MTVGDNYRYDSRFEHFSAEKNPATVDQPDGLTAPLERPSLTEAAWEDDSAHSGLCTTQEMYWSVILSIWESVIHLYEPLNHKRINWLVLIAS